MKQVRRIKSAMDRMKRWHDTIKRVAKRESYFECSRHASKTMVEEGNGDCMSNRVVFGLAKRIWTRKILSVVFPSHFALKRDRAGIIYERGSQRCHAESMYTACISTLFRLTNGELLSSELLVVFLHWGPFNGREQAARDELKPTDLRGNRHVSVWTGTTGCLGYC